MQRKSLSSPKENPDLDKFAEIIKSCRYFNKISMSLLKEMLRQGEFVTLKAEEYLMYENHSKPPELIVLLEGSLAVTSKNHFIMRLNHPGEVVGEMSVISDNPNKGFFVKQGFCFILFFRLFTFNISMEKRRIRTGRGICKVGGIPPKNKHNKRFVAFKH